MTNNISKSILGKKNEIFIFFFFLIYFYLWNKFNQNNIEINNNSLTQAIDLYNFKPYLSYALDSIISSINFKYYLGYIILPSLWSLLIFIIIKKYTLSNIWAYSISLLSMTSSENFPFINFLFGFFKSTSIFEYVNFYENFEIMGFPIPSFSIIYFGLLFYFSLEIIKIKTSRLYILTFLWFLGIFVHPVDGLLGLFYWISLIYFLSVLKKFKFDYLFIFFILFLSTISLILIFEQISFDLLVLEKKQIFPIYNLIFYFALPLIIMIFLIINSKIDFYEFILKFLNIYILMFIELLIIFCSINGLGFDLAMFENRITMFLLHYLYYIPIIYYLNRDQFFLIKKYNKTNIFIASLNNFLFFIFNKYKNFYLIPFTIMLLAYLILSLGIYA